MHLTDVLQKQSKTLDDAQFIYGNIRKFRFFDNFFAQNLKIMDSETILSLCQNFEYERIEKGSYVFQRGDASNNKFYVILSGQVSIVLPKKGEGSRTKARSPKNKRMSKIEARMHNIVAQQGRVTPQLPSAGKKESIMNLSLDKISLLGKRGSIQAVDKTHYPFANMDTILKEKKQKNIPESKHEPEDSSVNSRTNGTVTNQREEGEVHENLDQVLDFEECTSGPVVRHLIEGESFGELALKNNEPRSASVFCNMDCEFLVITKQQFDLMFLKRDQEKENFLKASFPGLKGLLASTTSLNRLLYSFKTEAYGKDSYLTIEGKTAEKEPKFFIIHEGECRVEKNFSTEVNNPYDRSKPFVYKSEPLQLAVVGKGMVVGEEILITEDEYHYSVKALSENVIVHSLTKKDFESNFFKEFHGLLVEMYWAKKNQRDVIYETVKKENEARLKQYKDANIYFLKNTRMKSVISKPAIQGLSRYLHREEKSLRPKDLSFTESTKPSESSSPLLKPFLPSMEVYKGSRFLKSHLIGAKTMLDAKKRIQMSQTIDLDDSKTKILNTTTDASGPTLTLQKTRSNDFQPEDFEACRFFEVDPRKINSTKNSQAKSINLKNNVNNNAGSEPKLGYNPVDSLIKGIIKKAKKAKRFNETLVDITGKDPKNASKQHDNDKRIKTVPSLVEVDRPAKTSSSLFETAFSTAPKQKIYKDRTPTNSTSQEHTLNFQRRSTTLTGFSSFSVKNAGTREKDFDLSLKKPITLPNEHTGNSIRDTSTSFSKFKLSEIDEYCGRENGLNFGMNTNKTPDPLPITLNLELEGNNQSPSPQSRTFYPYDPNSQARLNGINVSPTNSRLHGLSNQRRSPVLKAADWRNSIFKKIPKKISFTSTSFENMGLVPKQLLTLEKEK